MSVYVTDTHPLVWYATDTHRRLSRKVLRTFEAAWRSEVLIYVPVREPRAAARRDAPACCPLSPGVCVSVPSPLTEDVEPERCR